MNPQYAAQNLSQYGRGGDTTLMHVQPREMQGIATLLGRPLTQNPNTGLPEAFGWREILPIVAGLAATVVTGGAAAPIAGALAAGATKAAVTGDLAQGVMTGITSYATAGLVGDIGAAANLAEGAAGATATTGTAALTNTGTQAGIATATETGGQAALGAGAGVVGDTTAAAVAPAAAATPAIASGASLAGGTGAPIPPAPAAPPIAAALPPLMGPPAPPPGVIASNVAANTPFSSLKPEQLTSVRDIYASQPLSDRLSDLGRGFTSPSTLGSVISRNPMGAATAVGGNLMALNSAFNSPEQPERRRPATGNYNPIRPMNGFEPPPVGYNAAQGNGFITRFAEGGVASLDGGNMRSLPAAKNLMHEATAALLGEHPRPQQALNRFTETFGPAMLVALRKRVVGGGGGGGKVSGSGGGLDDLVPGSIEGRQKVRLADGEFVVSSDVVSGLGDGSTEHGSRKLHEMMDRVRRERTGSERQPRAVNDRRVMPA